MNLRTKKLILSLLVIGQLGLVGCATPQVRTTAPVQTLTTSPTLNPSGLETLATSPSVWAAPKSGLQPVYMGLGGISDGEIVLFCIIGGVALLTIPLWGPFYLVHDWFQQRR